MSIKQTGFETPKIAAANEPHLACVLLLDTSGSMAGEPIKSLNKGINDFREKTSLDEMAKKRVDIAIITFDDETSLVQDFTPILDMKSVELETGGITNMGAAINFAIDKVKERNKFYDSMGTKCFKPWIFMITDGVPTDKIDAAAKRIAEEETKGKLKFIALGVEDYDKDVLFQITNKVMELKDTDFSGIFNWLSESMATISVSRVGAEAQLPELPDGARKADKDVSDW